MDMDTHALQKPFINIHLYIDLVTYIGQTDLIIVMKIKKTMHRQINKSRHLYGLCGSAATQPARSFDSIETGNSNGNNDHNGNNDERRKNKTKIVLSS